jgi:hypothetical protein
MFVMSLERAGNDFIDANGRLSSSLFCRTLTCLWAATFPEDIKVYLRRFRSNGHYHYSLRESYLEEGTWKHRNLMDLGPDPGSYIEYPGGNGFFFQASLEETLQAQGVNYSSEDLEELFLPFMDPDIRRIVENFRGPGSLNSPWKSCSPPELLRLQQDLHSFDKRRLHYLRCGRVDIGRLEQRVWKFLNILLGKSRDEIEHTIDQMEMQLRPHEMRSYLFTAFHLQSYFPNHLLRNQPAALDAERVDQYFLEEICRLNGDAGYFRGVSDRSGRDLHPLLVKYVILYFDHDFDHRSLWNQYVNEFMQQRRAYRPPRSRADMPHQEACQHLNICESAFDKMTRRELIRHYRLRAKEIHPDTGGDHDAFIRLNEAFERLLRQKRGGNDETRQGS